MYGKKTPHHNQQHHEEHKGEHKDKPFPKEMAAAVGNFFQKFHGGQLLHAEWGTWISIIFLFIHFQAAITNQAITPTTNALVLILTFARVMFALRPFVGDWGCIWGPVWMMTCFATYLPLVFVAFTY